MLSSRVSILNKIAFLLNAAAGTVQIGAWLQLPEPILGSKKEIMPESFPLTHPRTSEKNLCQTPSTPHKRLNRLLVTLHSLKVSLKAAGLSRTSRSIQIIPLLSWVWNNREKQKTEISHFSALCTPELL